MIIGEADLQPPFFMPTFERKITNMFNLFKKRDESVKVIDRIWMSQTAKYNGLLALAKEDPELMIITWFSDTAESLKSAFIESAHPGAPVHLVRELHGGLVRSHKVVFAEHYPIRSKEQQVFKQWQLEKAIVHSSLDEPLFQQFGGERIVDMMKKLGMSETSQIEHTLVSKSIRNAQDKVESKVTVEQPATSSREWIERNVR